MHREDLRVLNGGWDHRRRSETSRLQRVERGRRALTANDGRRGAVGDGGKVTETKTRRGRGESKRRLTRVPQAKWRGPEMTVATPGRRGGSDGRCGCDSKPWAFSSWTNSSMPNELRRGVSAAGTPRHAEPESSGAGMRGSPESRRRRAPAEEPDGQRRQQDRERVQEEGEVHEEEELTRKVMGWTRTPGKQWSRRNRRRSAAAGEGKRRPCR